MIVDQEKWNAIIAATQEGIQKWNDRAKEKNKADMFFCCSLTTHPKVHAIVTHHKQADGYIVGSYAVMRECETGRVIAAKPVFTKGQITGVKAKKITPKAWDKLADKPADEIARKLNLLHFLLVIGASMIEERSEGPWTYEVRGFHGKRDFNNSKSDAIVLVDCAKRYGGDQFKQAQAIAGAEYIFCTSTNINKAVPDEAKNILFHSDEEMYALAPALAPVKARRAR